MVSISNKEEEEEEKKMITYDEAVKISIFAWNDRGLM